MTAGLLRMRWILFAAFAGAAGVAWASYAALIGYLGGRAFEDNVGWGLLLGFGIAAAVYLVVEAARRIRRLRLRKAARRSQAALRPASKSCSP